MNQSRVYYRSMVEIALVEQWVSIGAGVATVFVVYLLWKTVKEMEEASKVSKVQVAHRFRPWVGPSSGIEFMRTTPEGKEQFVVTLKNYGEIPASNVVAMFAMKNEIPTRDKLKADDVDKFSLGPLLPNMEKRYWFFVDSDTLKRTKDGNGQIFVGLYFAYEFAGGKSGYGMISQFNREVNTFVHKDMWAD